MNGFNSLWMCGSPAVGGFLSLQGATKQATCAFCKNLSSNPVLGEIVQSHELAVHLNCLYAASGLIQRVDPDAGSLTGSDQYMFGFDIQEVKAEICRGRRLHCRYCGIVGACVGCIKKRCQYSFHLPCLYDAKGFVCFKKSFEAFCYKHRPKQDLVSRLLAFKDDPPTCCICLFSVAPDDDNKPNTSRNPLKLPSNGKVICPMESVVISNHAFCLDQFPVRRQQRKSQRAVSTNMFQKSDALMALVSQQQPNWMRRILSSSPAPLKTTGRTLLVTTFDAWCHGVIHGGCCRIAWMHRECVAAYACSAGLHHVKCPICFDRDVFIPTIIDFGVWVPDRDASWELESGSSAMSETRPLRRLLEFIADEEADLEPLPSTQHRRSRPPPTRALPRRRITTVSARPPSRPVLRECRCVRSASFHECILKTSAEAVGADEDKENVNPLTRSARPTRLHSPVPCNNNDPR
uniref:G2:M phase specific E3 ubiquitin protein ligase n=1 Tax=Echinococcus granulosus TaxID=6210 RepID=A0A068X027_ECHGR|nr:G2:M phase specific E3 ubiquitin protein ligase [Echinococcus granulosus]